MENKNSIFKIPSSNMPWFKSRLAVLNKKAVKCGTDPISFEIIKSYAIPMTRNGSNFICEYNEVVVAGISPKIAGWTFLGTIQHTEAGNIIRVAKDSSIPEEFRTVKQSCGHCGKDRNRKDTYLVRNENGELKQLGKACLKDYTGHINPSRLAQLAEFLHEISLAEESDFSSLGGSFKFEASVEVFLRLACESVIKDGAYVTKKQSQSSNLMATSEVAWNTLFSNNLNEFIPLTHTTAGEDLYNKVMYVVNELENKTRNDFENNVLIACKKGFVQLRDSGLVAAAIMIYQKSLILKMESEKNAISNHIGTVKERRDFEVTLQKVVSFEGAFGITLIYIMKDESGNIFTWKTGTGFNVDISTGDSIKIKATVKKHEEYKGVKQTAITRCVLLENKSKIPVDQTA